MRTFLLFACLLALPADAFSGRSEGAGRVGFTRDVLPSLNRAGCNTAGCHGAAEGKGGLRLSLFCGDPQADYEALVLAERGRRIDRLHPDQSLLLGKVTKRLPHPGAEAISPDSETFRVLGRWIEQGAGMDDPQSGLPSKLEVRPVTMTLGTGQRQQLRVAAVYAGRRRRDVTGEVRYSSTQEAMVKVDAQGRVAVERFGEAWVVVSYMNRSAAVRVTAPQTLPKPFPDFPANNRIDNLVGMKLKELGIRPSDLCTDAEFVRRVHLDVTGLLPEAEAVRAFLSDENPDKRKKLIDRLLASSDFADYQALKWGDLLRIKSEFPSNLWPNAVQAYHHWVRGSIASNKPYDRFVREILTATGSNFRVPPVNFYRAVHKRDPQGFAESAALVFMGVRLSCTRCHRHPSEPWSIDDNLGMAAFFPNIAYKRTQEWKEEIIYVRPGAAYRHPLTRREVSPKPLDGPAMSPQPGSDPRVALANWLTRDDNPYFARNIVNRIWYWLLGRGIVHEPDDLRPSNPPSNEALLAFLARQLTESDYDLRHIHRLILNSRTYQLSSKTNRWNGHDEVFFSHYPLKRLGAEALLDAINRVTESSDRYVSRIPEPFTVLPPDQRATQLTDGSIGLPFLETFGRPSRDSSYASERSCEVSMPQTLYMINAEELEQKVARSGRIARLAKMKDAARIVEDLYLCSLSRPPTEAERKTAVAYLGEEPKAWEQAIGDVMWAILNTREFLYNH